MLLGIYACECECVHEFNLDKYLITLSNENCVCVYTVLLLLLIGLNISYCSIQFCLRGGMRSTLVWTSLVHCITCSRPACVIVGRHIGSGAALWLEWEPSNIPRQIPEVAIKRDYTFNFTLKKKINCGKNYKLSPAFLLTFSNEYVSKYSCNIIIQGTENRTPKPHVTFNGVKCVELIIHFTPSDVYMTL